MSETQKPFIQIDDEVREMTDEELQEYEAFIVDAKPLPTAD